MSTIVTRSGKGSSLSWAEADENFTNLNTDKLEATDLAAYETTAHAASTYAPISTTVTDSDIGVTVQAYAANLAEYAAVNPTAAGLALLDDADASAQRTTLGLGTAATLNVGTGANNVVQLDGSGALPAVSGVNLTNLPTVAQIQPISASVSANNLTISASALTLDFRSVTLGSGAVTRVSGAPANLIISSGSTLGTINGVQSDIIVLALNNAGTIELAASNLAGGGVLSETGLISTTAEGGAGAADSATVVYSTTARTNVAYRVVGVIRSTQATAGTWATAPSLIQGQGGQALADMSSLGYGQTWQNVTGSRAASTTYYNTTGRPILVEVTTGPLAYTNITATVGGIALGNHYNDNAGGGSSFSTFIVPTGQSYSVAIAAGVVGSWTELR